jgi:hypothetical protein
MYHERLVGHSRLSAVSTRDGCRERTLEEKRTPLLILLAGSYDSRKQIIEFLQSYHAFMRVAHHHAIPRSISVVLSWSALFALTGLPCCSTPEPNMLYPHMVPASPRYRLCSSSPSVRRSGSLILRHFPPRLLLVDAFNCLVFHPVPESRPASSHLQHVSQPLT